MWLGDDFNSGEPCLGLLFSNSDVLPKPIVWLGDNPVYSKNDIRLCGCSFFESLMSQLCGCSLFQFIKKPIVWFGDDFNSGFEQGLGLLFSKLNVFSESIVWLGGYTVLSKMTADCVATLF